MKPKIFNETKLSFFLFVQDFMEAPCFSEKPFLVWPFRVRAREGKKTAICEEKKRYHFKREKCTIKDCCQGSMSHVPVSKKVISAKIAFLEQKKVDLIEKQLSYHSNLFRKIRT